MRFRVDTDANYKSVFLSNLRTIRFKLDQMKPFGQLSNPEIEDVAINDVCYAGCSYCYTSAKRSGTNFANIVGKANDVWGSLPHDERPYQIAIGGAGESTIHPDWCYFVKAVLDLGIIPNYTTNGMHLADEILHATERYCGGVALSWHPHIESTFHKAVQKLSKIKTKLNFHIIVGPEDSVDDLKRLYHQYRDVVEYFVILPYQAAGRGKELENVENHWRDCFAFIESVDSKQFAFGALFYEWLLAHGTNLNMSIYEPEIFSGYRMLGHTHKTLFKSSYDLTPKGNNYETVPLRIPSRPHY